jgi:hypothetical protein
LSWSSPNYVYFDLSAVAASVATIFMVDKQPSAQKLGIEEVLGSMMASLGRKPTYSTFKITI